MDAKQLVAIAVAAIMAISAVGIAYAYTASTENSNNEVSTDFFKIIQTDGTGTETYKQDYTYSIYWDTFTQSAEKVVWTLNYEDMEEPYDEDSNRVLVAAADVAEGIDVVDNADTTEVNEAVTYGLILVGQTVLEIVPNGTLQPFNLYLYNTEITDGDFIVVYASAGTRGEAVDAANIYKDGHTALPASHVENLSTDAVTRQDALGADPAFSQISDKFVCINVYAKYDGYVAPAASDVPSTQNVNESLPSIQVASSDNQLADYASFTLSFAAKLYEEPTYDITIQNDTSEKGTVTSDPEQITGLEDGTTVTLTFTPATNLQKIVSIEVDGVDQTITDADGMDIELTIDGADIAVVVEFGDKA